MQYSTLPFTLVGSDQPYLIDVGYLYAQAQTLLDRRKARGRRYELAWMVKDNQPSLRDDIELLFEEECISAGWSAPPVDFTLARSVDAGHGRIEERILTASSLLADYSDWPYLAQVFKLEYSAIDKQSGKLTTAVRYGVTSAPTSVLNAERLLGAVRRHWGIETALHGRRDGSLQEDAMRTCTGNAPHVQATSNNLVLGIFGRQGITNVAEAQRAIANHLDRFLHHLRTAGTAPATP